MAQTRTDAASILRPAGVEHDPMEIFAGQYGALAEVLARCGLTGADLTAVGIANQRETTVVWEKRPAGRSAMRWCGSAGAPQKSATPFCSDRTLTDSIRRRDRAAAGRVFFGDQDASGFWTTCPGAQERAARGEAAVRHGGQLADLEADRRARRM